MFNLLPTEDRENAKKEYHRRVIISALGLLVFIFAGVLATLIPILMNVLSLSSETSSEIKKMQSRPAVSDYKDLEEIISYTKKEVDVLKDNLSRRTHIFDVVSRIIEKKPQGIIIKDIAWASDGAGNKVILGGKAENRDLLRRFEEILNSDGMFKDIILPISSYAKSEGADFSITIILKNTSNEQKQ